LDLKEQECALYGNAKLTTTQHECLPNTGLMFTESEMLELAEPQTSPPLISSAAASHAKTLVRQVKELGLGARDRGFGLSISESFASYDPDTSSLKTSQTSLLEDLPPSLVTLPQSGTMRSGRLFRHVPWAPHTCGAGCSSWPTPAAQDRGIGGSHNVRKLQRIIGRQRLRVSEAEWLMGFPVDWTDLED